MPPATPLLLTLAAAAAATTAPHHRLNHGSVLASIATRLPSPRVPPPTPVWPDVFHAVMVSEGDPRPGSDEDPVPRAGGAIVDLYYNWPERRTLHIIRYRLSNATLHDAEHGNRTSFYWTTIQDDGDASGPPRVASCKRIEFPVSVLPPNWLHGAQYVGRFSMDGVPCDLWTKEHFVEYCARLGDGVPVQWRFTAEVGLMHVRVFRWGVGERAEEREWQAPAECF